MMLPPSTASRYSAQRRAVETPPDISESVSSRPRNSAILSRSYYDLCRHHEMVRDSMATRCGTPPNKRQDHQNCDGGDQYSSVNPIIRVGLSNQPVDCRR